MKKSKLLTILTITAIWASGCSKDVGSGPQATGNGSVGFYCTISPAVDIAETTLPKEVTDALENKGKKTHDKELDEEKQAAMDPAERLLAGKTPMASEAMSAAEPVPLVRAAEDEEKKETDD